MHFESKKLLYFFFLTIASKKGLKTMAKLSRFNSSKLFWAQKNTFLMVEWILNK